MEFSSIKNYLKPNKFKVRFTLFFILVGGLLTGIVLHLFGGFEYHWMRSPDLFLSFFISLPSNLFSHFILFSLNGCREIGGEAKIIFSCLIPEALKSIVQQTIFYYLLACTLYGQTKKIQFYRFYFFIILLVHIQMYSNYYSLGRIPLILCIDIPLTIMALLGLFFLASQKAFLKPTFWKAYFFIYIAWDIFMTVIPRQIIPIHVIQRLIFLLPLYIALYLYAFRTTRKGNKCLLSGKEWPVPVTLRKVIKYGAFASFALIIVVAAGLIYLIFFQPRINEPSECMYKPWSDVAAIESAIANYYAIPSRTKYPPSMSDLCNEGNLKDLCESYSSIEALETSITLTMIDAEGAETAKIIGADGVETADMSKGREQVIRIHYPNCKCPREIQRDFPEWVDNCVFQVSR